MNDHVRVGTVQVVVIDAAHSGVRSTCCSTVAIRRRRLPRTSIATPLELQLQAGTTDRARSATDKHHANDAVRQTRHFAAFAAKKVRVLGAVISILSANELETPQMPKALSGDETRTDEIHQVAVQRRAIVSEACKRLDNIRVGQGPGGSVKPRQNSDSWCRSPEPGFAKRPAPLGRRPCATLRASRRRHRSLMGAPVLRAPLQPRKAH